MTKKDYIALVNEFGLYYDAETTSAYYNEYPICGYRLVRSNFGTSDWNAKSLIIFENYIEKLNEHGHYAGFYIGKFATKVEKARQLISNQIVYIKKKNINERMEKMNQDF